MIDKAKVIRDFIADNAHRPFEWGQWDCVLMAAIWADHATGNNYAGPYVGTYDSEEGAREIIERDFDGTMTGVFDSYYTQVSIPFCKRGDVVLCVVNGKETYGILLADRIALAGPRGILLASPETAKPLTAWRIEICPKQ